MKAVIATYIRYFWHATEGFHAKAVLRTVLGILRVAVMLVFVWFSKSAIDCATGKIPGSDTTLVMWFALMIACMLIDILLSQSVKYIESRSLPQMNNRVSRRLFYILMTSPGVHGKQAYHSGDMLNRLTLDVRTLSSFAISQLPSIVVMLFQLLASFAFLAFLNPNLALAPIIIMPVCLLAGKMYFKRQRRLTAEMRDSESRIHILIQESLIHRTVLKSLESTDQMNQRLGTLHHNLDSVAGEQSRLSTISGTFVRVGFVLGYLTAFGWGIFSLKAGVITFGTMSAFLQLVNRIQNPIAGLFNYLPSFISTSVAIDRLREIDSQMPQAAPRHSCKPLTHAGVHVENLSFKYESDGKDVLFRFSHDFKPGSSTMIVGSTGAGKTTLIKLLLGILEPNEGTIEIYGDNERRQVSTSTLCNFRYVPQGNTLFSGTIRDNLLIAAPQASDDRLAEALRIAAADFVFDLPLGLDTRCNEAGGGLSEGQAQRIAIARALLRPGSILILDEFNSSLDADTASTLMHRLSDSFPSATIIIIAHHQSPLTPYCNTILHLSPHPEAQNRLETRK